MTEKPRMLYRIIVPNQVGGDDERWFYLSPVRLAADSPHPTLPCPVAILLARSEDGRLVCVGMRIGVEANRYPPAQEHHEITASMLRGIRLGQIVADMSSYWGSTLSDDVEARAVAFAGERRRPGRKGYPDAFYEGIRDLFREAQVMSPGSVYRYIVERAKDAEGRPMYTATDNGALQLSREGVARKWVSTTRKKGFLGGATPGKAGELPAQDGTKDEQSAP